MTLVMSWLLLQVDVAWVAVCSAVNDTFAVGGKAAEAAGPAVATITENS
jgi:hypothetical protein